MPSPDPHDDPQREGRPGPPTSDIGRDPPLPTGADGMSHGALARPPTAVTADVPPAQPPASSTWSGVFGTVLPDRVGKYTIARLIGAGGMGAVFEAVQESPRRAVALKLLKAGIANEKSLRRFQVETEVLARLNHRCIAQIFEAGTHESPLGPVPYFAMELVGGGNAALTVGAMAGSDTAALGGGGRAGAPSLTVHARSRSLTVAQRLELMVHICDAVQHAHEKGVIHRDLKPDNILVDESAALPETRTHAVALTSQGHGAPGVPKIIDFGIARLNDPNDQSVTDGQMPTAAQPIHTTHGHPIGTLAYMSPEQTLGDPSKLDRRSDIYALGVILFELLTGRLPYQTSGISHQEAVRRVRDTRPIAPSRFEPSLQGDIENIILKALRRDREERYQSAGEMRDDLERVLQGRRARAKRLRPFALIAGDARAFVGRHPRFATVAAVALAAILALITWAQRPLQVLDDLYQHAIFQIPVRAEKFTKVCVIALDEGMDSDAVAAELARCGLGGLDPTDIRNVRAIYARLLTERLAKAGVPAVGFDITFNPPDDPATLEPDETPPPPLDPRVNAMLAGAIGELARHDPPIPVVITYDEFPLDQSEPIILDELRAAGVRHGLTWTVPPRLGGTWFHIFQKPDGSDPRPSLQLALAMSALHPGCTPVYRWDSRHNAVEVTFVDSRVPGAAADRDKTIYVGSDDHVDYEPRQDGDGLGLLKKDMICARLVRVPVEPCLSNSVLPLSKVLSMDADALGRWIDGRAVMIANQQASSGDFTRLPDGRELSGSWIVTAGTEALAGGIGTRALKVWWVRAAAALAAVLGAAAAWRLARRRDRLLAVGGLCLAIVLFFAALFAWAHLAATPFPPILALTLSAIGCGWIVSAYRARTI